MTDIPTFADLEFKERSRLCGIQARHTFPNGYGVSVIKGGGTYGGDEGLYELAVLHDGELCYDTPVTDDVEGYLTPERVSELLAQVAALPERVAPC